MLIAPPTQLTLEDLNEAHTRHGSVAAMLAAERGRPTPAVMPRVTIDGATTHVLMPWNPVRAGAGEGTSRPLAIQPLTRRPSRLVFPRATAAPECGAESSVPGHGHAGHPATACWCRRAFRVRFRRCCQRIRLPLDEVAWRSITKLACCPTAAWAVDAIVPACRAVATADLRAAGALRERGLCSPGLASQAAELPARPASQPCALARALFARLGAPVSPPFVQPDARAVALCARLGAPASPPFAQPPCAQPFSSPSCAALRCYSRLGLPCGPPDDPLHPSHAGLRHDLASGIFRRAFFLAAM
jgi:hypothetical protein